MKLIVICGSPDATSQFSRSLKDHVLVNRNSVLVSSDVNVLIHQRRSANPPQYAVADVSDLSIEDRADIFRHFPEARRSHVLFDSTPIADILHLVKKSL